MKRSFLIISLILWFTIAFAQEGEKYRSTSRSIEKKYEVRQRFGKNILTLKTKTISYYDTEGIISYRVIYKGNLTYLGKEERYYSTDPKSVETKYFNYTNQMTNRKATIYGQNPLEYTELEYDSKGAILEKRNVRI